MSIPKDIPQGKTMIHCENCENYKPKPVPVPKSAMEDIFELVRQDISLSTLRLHQPLLDAARAEWEAMKEENERLKSESVEYSHGYRVQPQPGEVERELIEAWENYIKKGEVHEVSEKWKHLVFIFNKFKSKYSNPASPTALEKAVDRMLNARAEHAVGESHFAALREARGKK